MKPNILFLCTGNSARSQMAEALLRKHAGDYFEAFSAGTEPRQEVFSPVVEVMQEVGIDISNHKPKAIEGFLGRVHFASVIVVCSDAEKNCPLAFGTARRFFWPFDDPAAATGSAEDVLRVCRGVRDQIDRRICEWLKGQGIDAQPLA
jgi:arsenate reductase